jgi:hypothetical protein
LRVGSHFDLHILPTLGYVTIILNMRFTVLIAALLAPLVVLTTPVELYSRSDLITARQARPTKPPPCVRVMNTTEAQTATRANAFAQAFIYKKDISEAFKYIAKDYIVRGLRRLE